MDQINELIIKSIDEMKQSIDNLSSSLNGRIDNLDAKLNRYSERVVALEESNKNQVTTKVLLSLVGLLVGYIVNHLIK